MTSGVYMITNTLNNKQYIGQSKNIELRWLYHTKSLNKKDRKNQELYKDIKLYGEDTFSISILVEEEDREKRLVLESEAILKHKTLSPRGYNTDLYHHIGHNSVYSKSLNCMVSSDELKNKLIHETFESVASHYQVSSNTIRKWCKKLGIPSKSTDYSTNEKKLAYANKMRKISKENGTYLLNARKVNMLDKNSKEIIKTFDTMTEAAKFVKASSPRSIYGAINHIENRQTCKGYAWEYA